MRYTPFVLAPHLSPCISHSINAVVNIPTTGLVATGDDEGHVKVTMVVLRTNAR